MVPVVVLDMLAERVALDRVYSSGDLPLSLVPEDIPEDWRKFLPFDRLQHGHRRVHKMLRNPPGGLSVIMKRVRSDGPAKGRKMLHSVEVVVVGGDGEPRRGKGKIDPTAIEYCAGLDHSDTDNAKRLLTYHEGKILVIAQDKAKEPMLAVWDGRKWDYRQGREKATLLAQEIGDLIQIEATHLKPDKDWQEAIDEAKPHREIAEEDRTGDQKKTVAKADEALAEYAKRVKRRREFGVSSKNSQRVSSMLKMAWPHVLKRPDEFNADPLRFACQNATLTFKPVHSSDGSGTCQYVRLEVLHGHRSEHLITQLANASFDRDSECPEWIAFLEKVLPDPEVRRLVQVASGLGLVGVKVQKLFFHYGAGANGKSVYMEVLARLLGDMAVTLPATSLIGESGPGGGASPDLARLYGCRFLRVKELPEGEDLKENLVKELTGGETITARDLFAGYMDFEPLFVAMMSGNGYPRIKGTDEGIWRRMSVVHWPVKIPDAERREFEEMMAMFKPEYSGILNWLIEGVAIFLTEGLVIPEAVRGATQEYRDSQDPTAAFVARCIVVRHGAEIPAGELYDAYARFAEAERGRPISNNAFGRIVARKFTRIKRRDRFVYTGIALSDEFSAPRPTYGDDEPFPESGL
ncbi:DNA primase family protein [Ciceribacter thiooxidans]|uniref:Phage/plasmid primase, P4 family n=1 Tax=Ciceribacter thiooxidans TaxID=1969821 RepID=A0ABV7I445_9HYPH|nr:DNA primase family protein [Ciceribacter thiooxidans]